MAFHAVRAGRTRAVRLTGYEDSRPRFVGRGTLREPRALAEGRARAPDDEGLLHTFDPCASLRVEVDLEPRGSATLVFVDGWVEDERDAPALIARHLGIAAPRRGCARARVLPHAHARRLAPAAPRPSPPFAVLRRRHRAADPRRHAAAVDARARESARSRRDREHDGAIFSFAGNAQKNALTPFTLDTIPAAAPGQAVYVVPLESACRRRSSCPQPHGPHEICFGRGYATFRQAHGELALELEICVVPDAPVELRLLRIENRGARSPRAAAWCPISRWCSPSCRSTAAGSSRCAASPRSGALFFSNPENDFTAGSRSSRRASRTPRASACARASSAALGAISRIRSSSSTAVPDPSAPDDGIRIASFAGEVEVPAGGVEHGSHRARADAQPRAGGDS